MIDPLITFVLLAAIAVVSIGAARIVSWLLDRRDRAAVQRAKEAAIVAQARAELDATGWTEDDEAAYQRDPYAYDRELPGMWEASDFMGGRDYELDPVTRDEVNRGR
ncbi:MULTISPECIES: hypothetical protein [unclassified Stenotrophomonas]|uniref:hypothetical protein n=1 Tax=Stenotrophomonas TaxID=40323 RepID=UPI001299BB1D|nr:MULTISPECIES: hypothetical protein [unclassified Stenotrophomonas]MBA0255132.1 hypothetical protein [Stenotrophomonas maltophilia]MBA0481485.1 hypothetical protein [Stenotrophomonas maltophilia]MBA0488531.1 hypothetical protein [Stenotrophomonas maltophilia]MBA0493825.1 hypothetical protein [Stenotrophomonas maltophilia]MBH1516371.1 hypothetical protein [Stenotrophomonas maltophilia]